MLLSMIHPGMIYNALHDCTCLWAHPSDKHTVGSFYCPVIMFFFSLLLPLRDFFTVPWVKIYTWMFLFPQSRLFFIFLLKMEFVNCLLPQDIFHLSTFPWYMFLTSSRYGRFFYTLFWYHVMFLWSSLNFILSFWHNFSLKLGSHIWVFCGVWKQKSFTRFPFIIFPFKLSPKHFGMHCTFRW